MKRHYFNYHVFQDWYKHHQFGSPQKCANWIAQHSNWILTPTQQTIKNWYHGKSVPGFITCAHLSIVTGIELADFVIDHRIEEDNDT
jgi:hypothetical protein